MSVLLVIRMRNYKDNEKLNREKYVLIFYYKWKRLSTFLVREFEYIYDFDCRFSNRIFFM